MLVAQQSPRDRILLQSLYTAGVRCRKQCASRWRNVRPHGDAGQITVFGKNGQTRADRPASAGVVGADRPARVGRRGGAGFPSRSGKALDRGRVRIILRNAAAGSRHLRPGIPTFFAPRHASPRPRPRGATPLGSRHARSFLGGDHQHLLARPPRRLQRTLSGRCIEKRSKRHGPGAEGHQNRHCCATGAPCGVGQGQVGEEGHRRARSALERNRCSSQDGAAVARPCRGSRGTREMPGKYWNAVTPNASNAGM